MKQAQRTQPENENGTAMNNRIGIGMEEREIKFKIRRRHLSAAGSLNTL